MYRKYYVARLHSFINNLEAHKEQNQSSNAGSLAPSLSSEPPSHGFEMIGLLHGPLKGRANHILICSS